MSASENQIVVYQPNETVRLDVRFDNETAWMPQPQIAELFACSLENVRLHLKNIYARGELDKAATSKESLEVRQSKTFHDRFLIVDDKELYLIGASLKDAGRLTFAVAKMGGEIIPGLLAFVRKAMTESVVYSELPFPSPFAILFPSRGTAEPPPTETSATRTISHDITL